MPLHIISEFVLLALLVVVFIMDFRNRRRLEAENLRLQGERSLVVGFMHDLAVALERNSSKEALMQTIVNSAMEATGALSACLYERTSDDQLRPAALNGLFPPQTPLNPAELERMPTRARFLEKVLRSERLAIGQGVAGAAAQHGTPVLIRDARQDPRVVQHDDTALAVRSLVVVPLRFNQHCFGVLVLANPSHGGAFGDTEFELAVWLGEQASLALHNADFLHVHMQRQQIDLDNALARGIQTMLLPGQRRCRGGLDIDLRYQPAQRVGGDLHDLFELASGRIGFAIADVSGKGIPASLMMTGCRSALRQIAPRFDSPAEVLRELNKAMLGDMQPGMFITVFYAVYEPQERRLVFARAGHEPALLMRPAPQGSLSAPQALYLQGEGLAVGLVDDDFFERHLEEQSLFLRPGDVLTLYTDGITEAANLDGREFSGARLVDTVRGVLNADACTINDTLLKAVDTFVDGCEQRDDYTLLTVRIS